MPYKPPYPYKDTRWSAIALDKKRLLVDYENTKFIGLASMRKTMKETQEFALFECKKDEGIDCEVLDVVPNQCISLSTGGDGLMYFFNPDVRQAAEMSLIMCNREFKNCRFIYSACSFPDF